MSLLLFMFNCPFVLSCLCRYRVQVFTLFEILFAFGLQFFDLIHQLSFLFLKFRVLLQQFIKIGLKLLCYFAFSTRTADKSVSLQMLNLALQLDCNQFDLLFKFFLVVFKLDVLIFQDFKLIRWVVDSVTLGLVSGFCCMIIVVRFLMI